MNKRIEAAYEQRPRRWVFEMAVAVVVVALLIWSGSAQRPRRWVFEMAVAVVVVALLIWSGSAVETAGTTQNGAVIAWNILAGIFHPDTDLLFNFTTQGVPYLLLETICIAFLGTIVGAIISIPLAFLSASNLTPKPVAFVGRIIIMAVRTVPAFVYGLMFIRSFCGAYHHYGRPHRSRLRLWTHVYPGHRPRRLCRPSDHVPVFGGYGEPGRRSATAFCLS